MFLYYNGNSWCQIPEKIGDQNITLFWKMTAFSGSLVFLPVPVHPGSVAKVFFWICLVLTFCFIFCIAKEFRIVKKGVWQCEGVCRGNAAADTVPVKRQRLYSHGSAGPAWRDSKQQVQCHGLLGSAQSLALKFSFSRTYFASASSFDSN